MQKTSDNINNATPSKKRKIEKLSTADLTSKQLAKIQENQMMAKRLEGIVSPRAISKSK
jgi:hypothetical protein